MEFYTGNLSILSYLYHCRLMDMYFILWVIIQFITYFVAQISPALAINNSFSQLAPVSLWHMLITMVCFFNSTSLISGTMRCFRLILYISCPTLKLCHFSKGPWFLLLGNSIGNQDLGPRYTHCTGELLLLGPVNWQSKMIHVCIVGTKNTFPPTS